MYKVLSVKSRDEVISDYLSSLDFQKLFMCPISLGWIENACLLEATSQTFDRVFLKECLKFNQICPLTRKELSENPIIHSLPNFQHWFQLLRLDKLTQSLFQPLLQNLKGILLLRTVKEPPFHL